MDWAVYPGLKVSKSINKKPHILCWPKTKPKTLLNVEQNSALVVSLQLLIAYKFYDNVMVALLITFINVKMYGVSHKLH